MSKFDNIKKYKSLPKVGFPDTKTIKEKHPTEWSRILRAFLYHDPFRVLIRLQDQLDEYDMEISMVVLGLPDCQTKSDVQELLRLVMGISLCGFYIEKKDDIEAMSKDIWEIRNEYPVLIEID